MVVQRLRSRASATGGAGLIPGWGARIPHAAWPTEKDNRVV